ncbi:MAG: hypothetical protein M1834_001991 [Cirrosporium novae-zelandiae]|nr:MAG: hypothetical protein M1834_001991 [Cirrosporium novae-zelandiae]
MASDVSKSPFAKQLVSSGTVFTIPYIDAVCDAGAVDTKEREKALQSITLYLTTQHNTTFSTLDLLKIQKSLFYCLYHTPPFLPAQRLTTHLSNTLFLCVPPPLFLPFLSTFWTTFNREYPNLDRHRLAKYLLFARQMFRASIAYLAKEGWKAHDEAVGVDKWVELMEKSPLSTGREEDVDEGEEENVDAETRVKTPDGVRYHVLDVYVDEMTGVSESDDGEGMPVERLLEPIRRLEKRGWSKVLRKKAKEILEDERLKKLRRGEDDEKGGDGEADGGDDDDGWEGIED